MQIQSLTTSIACGYPAPTQTGLAQPATIATVPRDTNADSHSIAVVQNEATGLTVDRQLRRDAQPMYDQQLSHRGQRAQQLYATIEYASDLELLNRIDVVV